MISSPPVALILSILGLRHREHRGAAIAGVIISIAALFMFFVLPLVLRFCA